MGLLRAVPEWEGEGEHASASWQVGELLCTVQRAPVLGHLEGLVRLPPGHRLWTLGNCAEFPQEVHAACHRGRLTICLEVAGEEDTLYRLVGFDCRELGDLLPGVARILPPDAPAWRLSYPDFRYVRGRLENLANVLWTYREKRR